MASENTSGETALNCLRVVDVFKSFGAFTALRNVSFEIGRGEFVVLLGPSGCGKTTLLRVIGGLEVQSSGEVYYSGREISSLPPAKRGFGIVFQSYALFPNLTVDDNVAYGLKSRRRNAAAVRERVAELLEVVGLAEQGRKYPAQLSGGQQQRVALARALATSPDLLLLDEPLSALDARVRIRMRAELKRLQRRFDLTTVMVTHDQAEALALADRIVVMNQGVIEQIGTPAEIYQAPATPFVADFIGAMNFIRGEVVGDGDIRVGDLKLQCEVAAGRPSDVVTVAIRAEELKVASGSNSGCNTAPGTVEELEYGGSFCRALIRVSDLGDHALTVDLPIGLVKDEAIEVGSLVSVHVPQELIRVFPG